LIKMHLHYANSVNDGNNNHGLKFITPLLDQNSDY